MITLKFNSSLNASRAEIWQWITSAEGIAAEMPWWYEMRMPAELESLADAATGRPLGRCSLRFCGLPYGASRLTLVELAPGEGFFEQSPTTGMFAWQHRRWLEQTGDSVQLTDTLTFRPWTAKALNRAIVQRLFAHRHGVLRERFA